MCAHELSGEEQIQLLTCTRQSDPSPDQPLANLETEASKLHTETQSKTLKPTEGFN